MLRAYSRPFGRAPAARPRATTLLSLTENLCGIVAAWEALSTGAPSTAAVQSFATLVRRNLLTLSSAGCGAIECAVVELTLALDALSLTDRVSQAQLDRVDHAMAQLRAMTTQRVLACDLAAIAAPGEAPAFCLEGCPRCATSACPATRWR